MVSIEEQHYRRLQKLVDWLIEATPTDVYGNGGLKWQQVPRGDGFEYSLTRSTIRVRTQDGDGTYPYVLNILDDHARVVETIVDKGGEEGHNWNLGDLYNVASRSSRGAESKLSEILDELGIEDGPRGS